MASTTKNLSDYGMFPISGSGKTDLVPLQALLLAKLPVVIQKQRSWDGTDKFVISPASDVGYLMAKRSCLESAQTFCTDFGLPVVCVQ